MIEGPCALAGGCAETERGGVECVSELDRVSKRGVRAEVCDLPPVRAEEHGEHQEPDLMPLAGRAREHCCPAHARSLVREQPVQGSAHGPAREMLLRDSHIARGPALADLD